MNKTIQELKKEVRKYSSLAELQKNDSTLFVYLEKNNMVESICDHMDLSRRLRRKLPIYSKEEIIERANKYTRRADFKTHDVKAARDAKKLGIFEEVCAHMNLHKKVYNPITKKMSIEIPDLNDILDIAKKYKTREEFKHKNRSIYDYCIKINVFEQACAHMPKDASIKHSFEDALEKAKKCKTKSEFQLRFEIEYKSAYKRRYLDKICEIVDFERRDYSVSIGEKTALDYINRLLRIKLKPAKNIPWLRYKGNLLSLDGYDEKNKIAFEYNGHLHLKPKIKRKDNFKKRTCKKLGIKLITIREYTDIHRRGFKVDVPPAVKKECRRLKLKIKNPNARIIIRTNSNKMNINRIKGLISNYKTLKEFSENNPKECKFVYYLKMHYLLKDLEKFKRD